LSNDATLTSANQIGIKWTAPVFNGGSPLIDYRVWYDTATNGATFSVLQESVVVPEFLATGLTQGLVYQFKVEARNAYGFSVYSDTVSILTAQVPDQPSAPTTSRSGDSIIVTWSAPNSGGSPI
jgi:titin